MRGETLKWVVAWGGTEKRELLLSKIYWDIKRVFFFLAQPSTFAAAVAFVNADEEEKKIPLEKSLSKGKRRKVENEGKIL